LRVLQIDDIKELCLVVHAKDSSGDLPEELLQHRGDGVHAKAVDVDESALLKEVNELSHVALVAGRAKNVLLKRALLVELEQHDLKIYGGTGIGTRTE
jgi:hypothetical protein